MIEFVAGGGHHQDADETSGYDQVEAPSLDAEVVERDAKGDDEVDETGTGCSQENGDRHHQHSEKPKRLDERVLGRNHQGQRKRQR